MPAFRSFKQRCLAVGAVAGIALAASVPLVSGSASAAAGVTTFDQCQNGAIGNPPTLATCAGSGWTNGNLNGNNSHWAEGEFVPYRVALSGLGAGSHVLEISYRPGDSGGHAIDYLGSFDATETTSSTTAALHQNHADPCGDITMGAGWCTPATPTSSVAVKAPDFADADAGCGTAGTFTGPRVLGDIDLFGPTGSVMTGFNYVSENATVGGGCDTTVDVTFKLLAGIGSDNIVIAWGGHIASAQDWGVGHSASTVSGSPYHMSLDSVDGVVTGSMDRSMKTDAIYSVPSTPGSGSPSLTPTGTTTALKDGDTGQPWSGTETTGATAYDTAIVTGIDGPVPTGTATYTFFDNGTCQGSGTTQTVPLSDGVPQNAATTAHLGAGAYSFDAVYSGDNTYAPSAVSACEPFTVLPAPTAVSNIVFSKQTGVAWSGTEVAGGKADDTASLTGAVPGFVPTGTVTYSYFANGTCGGTPVWTDAVTLTGTGSVPDSNDTDALGAGTYSFDATYGGDSNYAASGASACEAFVVTPTTGSPSVDPSGNAGGSNSNGSTGDNGSSGTNGSGGDNGSGGTNGSGGSGGAAGPTGTVASDPSTPTAAPAAAAPATTPVATTPAATTPAAVTPAAVTPAGPVTKPSELAWTGADIGVTAAIGFGLLALGCFLVWSSRRRRHEVG
jgi:hypothetical protein